MPEARGRHLVIVIHGIRTFASWVARLDAVLRGHPAGGADLVVAKVDYGYFSLLAFLLPPLRWLVVRRVRKLIRREIEAGTWDRVDLVAHSFGTYLAAWSLRGLLDTGVRIHTLLLAGSVLRLDFDWDGILDPRTGNVRRVVNDCGTKDGILLLSQGLVLFTGCAGRLGFRGQVIGDRFANRYFELGHSGYFPPEGKYGDFMREWWAPLLLEDAPLRPHDGRSSASLAGLAAFFAGNADGVKLGLLVWLCSGIAGWVLEGRDLRDQARVREALRRADLDYAELRRTSAERLAAAESAVGSTAGLRDALEARRLWPDRRADELLRHSILNPIERVERFDGIEGELLSIDPGLGGALVRDRQGRLTAWSFEGRPPAPAGQLSADPLALQARAIRSDGKGGLRLFELNAGTSSRRPLPDGPGIFTDTTLSSPTPPPVVSPGGAFVAFLGERQIGIWDVERNRWIGPLGSDDGAAGAWFSADERRLLTVGRRSSLRLWSTQSDERAPVWSSDTALAALKFTGQPVRKAFVDAQAERIFLWGNGRLVGWDRTREQPLELKRSLEEPLAWCPTAPLLLCGAGDRVEVVQVDATGAVFDVRRETLPYDWQVLAGTIDDPGRPRLLVKTPSGLARIAFVPRPPVADEIRPHPKGEGMIVRRLDSIERWDAAGRVVGRGSLDRAVERPLSEDGRSWTVLREDDRVDLYGIEQPQAPRRSYPLPPASGGFRAVSRNGRYLAQALTRDLMEVADLAVDPPATRRLACSVKDEDEAVDLAVSDDGRWLAVERTLNDPGVDLVEVDSGDSLSFTPSSTFHGFSGGGRYARVVGRKEGLLLIPLRKGAEPIRIGPLSDVKETATSGDDGILVVRERADISVWSLPDGRRIGFFPEPSEPARLLGVLPGGTTVLLATKDGTSVLEGDDRRFWSELERKLR